MRARTLCVPVVHPSGFCFPHYLACSTCALSDSAAPLSLPVTCRHRGTRFCGRAQRVCPPRLDKRRRSNKAAQWLCSQGWHALRRPGIAGDFVAI